MATDTDTETGGLALTSDMAFDRHPQLHQYHLLVWYTCLEFCVTSTYFIKSIIFYPYDKIIFKKYSICNVQY